MTKVNKGDFIELEYTGKFPNGKIFDTSIKEIGEKEHLHKHSYENLIICVGEGQVIKGLDKSLDGSETEKDYTFNIKAEDAYGKKNPKLVRVVSRNLFTKQKMNPYPGMQINAEGMMGVVRSVSGGRIFVDFNHPFAGKDLIFDVRIKRILKDVKEKVESLLKSSLMLNKDKYKLEINGEKLKITSEIKLPDIVLNSIKDKIIKLIPEIKSIEFSKTKKEATT
jgi:FKBP-type peptidyl-prolyl cis-trans isomerase SlyD